MVCFVYGFDAIHSSSVALRVRARFYSDAGINRIYALDAISAWSWLYIAT